MSIRTCLQPNCQTQMSRGRVCCARHWHRLPQDLRDRHRYAPGDESRSAIQLEMRRFFEERMRGRHEIVDCEGPDCDGKMIYLKTSTGGFMPVDPDTVRDDDVYFDRSRHKSHFADCKNPNRFRKQR